MEDVLKGIGGGVAIVALLGILIRLGTLFGAIAGWVVGIFFGDTILGILSQLGVHNVTMWQFGAFMGFVGGFLRTTVTKKD